MLTAIARGVWPQCFGERDEALIYSEQCRRPSASFAAGDDDDNDAKGEPVEEPCCDQDEDTAAPKFDFMPTVNHLSPSQSSMAHELSKQHELQLEYNKRLAAFLLQAKRCE